MNFYESSGASNGSNTLMVVFYIQRDFQRHLTCTNPSSNEEVMSSTNWRIKTSCRAQTMSRQSQQQNQKHCHDKARRQNLSRQSLLCRDKSKTNLVITKFFFVATKFLCRNRVSLSQQSFSLLQQSFSFTIEFIYHNKVFRSQQIFSLSQ